MSDSDHLIVYKGETGEDVTLLTKQEVTLDAIDASFGTTSETHVYAKSNDLTTTYADLTGSDITSITSTSVVIKKAKLGALDAGKYTLMTMVSDGTRIKYFKSFLKVAKV